MAAEDRKSAVKRIRRLLDRANLSDLLQIEGDLTEKLGQKPKISNNHNPSGLTFAAPCSVCGGQRPPGDKAEPWHIRINSAGQELAKSGRCAPCVWAQQHQQHQQYYHLYIYIYLHIYIYTFIFTYIHVYM